MNKDGDQVLILADGTVCEITNMFDVDGDETDNPDMAFSVFARHPDGRWISQQVSPEMRITGKDFN
jgi:hypothetical protein